MPPTAGRANGLQQDLAELVGKEPIDPAGVLELLLDDAIRAGASQISIVPRRRQIRVRLLLGGKWIVRTTLPKGLWERLLEAIKQRSGIAASSTSWPQHGEIRRQTAAMPVTITRTKNGEEVQIEIPPGAAGTQGPPDASRSSSERRSRFWT